MEEEFNEDMACTYICKLWLKLAHKLSDDAILSNDPEKAIRYAMMADACYWQATGTQPAINIQEFIKENVK